jgi:autotransporter-associated beta strand protein
MISSRRCRARAAACLAIAAATASPAWASNLTWDASGTNGATPIDGSGTWSTSAVNWSDGTTDSAWPNDPSAIAVFGSGRGPAGTVLVAGTVSTGGITFNPAGSGTYNLAGSGSVSLGGSTPTITVNGTDATIGTTLTGYGQLTVAGTGTLTLAGSNQYTGGTAVTGGTLVVASAAALGPGGLTVSTGAAVDFAASTTVGTYGNAVNNSGSFTVDAGQTLSVGGTSGHFVQSAGTLTVNGAIALGSNGAFYDYGGTLNAPVNLTGSGTIVFADTAAPAGTFTFTGTNVSATLATDTPGGSIPAGVTVLIRPTAGTASLALANATNLGTITMTVPDGGTGNLGNAFYPVVNGGTLTVNAAGSLSSPVSAPNGLTNLAGATMNLNASTAVSGDVNNAGSLTVAAGQTLTIANSGALNLSGGALTVRGALVTGYNSPAGQIAVTGGTVNGTITIANGSDLSFGQGFAGGGTFAFIGSSGTGGSINGTGVPAGTTIAVQPSAGTAGLTLNGPANAGTLLLTTADQSSGQVNIAGPFTNTGTITLASTGTQSEPITFNGTVTNAVGGTLNFNASTSSAAVVNVGGTVNVAAGQTLTAALFNQSTGTLNVVGTMAVPYGSFVDAGGTINGTIAVTGVTFGPGATSGTFVDVGNGPSLTVAATASPGSVPAGTSVSLVGSQGSAHLELDVGTIGGTVTVATNSQFQGQAFLNSTSSVLTNSGTLNLGVAGTGMGFVTVQPAINTVAGGTLNVVTSSSIGDGSGNAGGTVNVAAGQLLYVNGSFNQSAGTMNLVGSMAVSSNGTFYDFGGTINGSLNLSGGTTVAFGPNAAPATFSYNLSPGNVNLKTAYSGGVVPAGVAVSMVGTTSPASFNVFGANTSTEAVAITNAGSLTLTAANHASGSLNLYGTTATNAGTITLADAGTASTPLKLNGFTTFVNGVGGRLNVNAPVAVTGAVTNLGTVSIAAGAKLDLSASPALTVGAGGTVTLAPDAASPAVVALHGVTWPAPTAGTTGGGSATITGAATASVPMSGQIDLGGTTATFNLGDPLGTLAVTAAIANGGLTKTGPGTLVLAGPATYAGNTTITGGTVRANNPTGLATGTGTVVIGSGGTLGGNGSVGAVTVAAGGTITAGADGATVGTLTTGVQAWNGSGALVAKVSTDGSANDRLVMTGLTLNATGGGGDAFSVTVASSGSPTLAANAGVILATDTDPSSANPFNAASPSAAGLSSLALTVTGLQSATGGFALSTRPDVDSLGGYDLVLVDAATPEPASLCLLAAPVVPLLLGRRRRRHG